MNADQSGMPDYLYSFVVWPEETAEWEKPLFHLFRQYPRVELTMNADSWATFTASLERQGFTLREVERTEAGCPACRGRGEMREEQPDGSVIVSTCPLMHGK